jgi:hypothetical protein
LSGATDEVVGVVANLLHCRTKFQMESHLEAHGDALRALPQVPTKGPVKAYKGTIHKIKAPPIAL